MAIKEGIVFGEDEALVVDGLVDNLISPVAFLDRGGELVMDQYGGSLTNSDGSASVPIYRVGDQWRVRLSDVEDFQDSGQEVVHPHLFRDSTMAAHDMAKSHPARRFRGDDDFTSSSRKEVHFQEPSWFLTEECTQNPTFPPRLLIPCESTGSHPRDLITGRNVNVNSETVYCHDVSTRRRLPTTTYALGAKIRKVKAGGILLRYIEGHERMGHANAEDMMAAVSGDNPTWRNFGLTSAQIYRAAKKYKCAICVLAKRRRNKVAANKSLPVDSDPMRSVLSSKNCKPGEIISMDPNGPVTPATAEGFVIWFLFKDVATGMLHTVTAKNQDTPNIQAAVNYVFDWYRSNGCTPKKLRVDDMKTTYSPNFKKWLLDQHGCVVESSVPYSHWQNAVERDVQTVLSGSSAMLHGQHWLRGNCWDLALRHFIDIRNRTPNKKCSPMSPLQKITKQVTDVSSEYKFIFGELLAVAKPGNLASDQRSWKFDLKNEVGIYIGEAEGYKRGHNVYWPKSHSTAVRYHCWPLDMTGDQFLHYYSQRSTIRYGTTPFEEVAGAVYDWTKDRQKEEKDLADKERAAHRPFTVPLVDLELDGPEQGGVHGAKRTREGNTVFDPGGAHAIGPEQGGVHGAKRSRQATEVYDPGGVQAEDDEAGSPYVKPREPRAWSRPVVPTDRVLRNRKRAFAYFADAYEEPYVCDTLAEYYAQMGEFQFMHQDFCGGAKLTVATALLSDERDAWIDAIVQEVMSLIEGDNPTFERVSGPGKRPYRIIHSTAQLKEKWRQDGTLDKLKCRLCGCGNELWGQIADTYSPTIAALTYACVHQIAIIDQMERCSVDVVQAYLNQPYPDDKLEIYITLPKNVAEVCGLDPKQLYRIRKYIYGLPDAGRAYYEAYSEHLISGGYERSVSDPCLFIKINGPSRVYVWCHVDDTFVCATDAVELGIFQEHVRKKFDITVQSQVEEYLGIKLVNDELGNCLMTQPKLIDETVREYDEELITLFTRAPMSPQRKKEMQSDDETPISQTEYLRLLGILNYLTKTRPEISTACSFGATHSAHPTRGNMIELLHCLNYLKHSREQGLLLLAGQPGRQLQLTCYVDASYLTHEDSKSHTGYCMSFGQVGTFYSKSGKQTLVATSSTHAEMKALYSLTVDLTFVVHLCSELHRPLSLPCVVMQDNQPVIDLLKDTSARSKRCKHFLMMIDWIREQVQEGLLVLQKVDTTDNLADVLTKIITGGEFRSKAALLRGN